VPHQRDASVGPLPGQRDGTVLVVDDEEVNRLNSAQVLRGAGYHVTLASTGEEALARVAEATPDLIVSDVRMPGLDGFALVARLRALPSTRAIPLILITDTLNPNDAVTGLNLGADDCLARPLHMGELVARVRSKLERPPVPHERLRHEPETGLLTEHRFSEELTREVARAARGGPQGHLAYLYLDELPRLRDRFGSRTEAEIAKQVTVLVLADARPLAILGRDHEGRFALLLPETHPVEAHVRLDVLSQRIASHVFIASGERLRLTPVIGYARFSAHVSAEQLREHALLALAHAATRLDLVPAAYAPGLQMNREPPRRATLRARLREALRLPLQLLLIQLVALIVPFFLYVTLAALGIDIIPVVYLLVVLALLITSVMVWIECYAALRQREPPDQPGSSFPAASAVIAAYLPNEAAIIVDTIAAFLRVNYPAPLQVILAYNTPHDLPIEAALHEIARRDPRFVPLRVAGSTSKAQNINAALAHVTGDFVGIFDADHHPQPDSFTRAWRWLSNGSNVVQGHCVVRNGGESWIARLLAVEFETIYAVSHPGRARLHNFGIFGGTNGYWRTDLLRQTRMHGDVLTEDIDSTARVLAAGYTITSDPHLVSRELTPVTLPALWHQRMRWSQGWFQVSLRHMARGLRSPKLSPRQKLGWWYLFGWGQIYPWFSIQMVPIIGYLLWQGGGPQKLNWFVPVFVATTLVTLSAGAAQTYVAFRLSDPELRFRTGWFIWYWLVSSVVYDPAKNLVMVVAQLNQITGGRRWRVTPRPSTTDDAVPLEGA
jgi:cellulose synthase/poly-beta-1,6-N-acetylglucosamine synthase-like glycosyltransferase/CheY-like chemotaxis protein